MYDNDDYRPGEYCTAYYCDEPTEEMKWVFEQKLSDQLDAMEEQSLKSFMKTASDPMKWVIETIIDHTQPAPMVDQRLKLLVGKKKVNSDGGIIDLYSRNCHAVAKVEGQFKWAPTIGQKGGRLYHPVVIMKDFVRDAMIIDDEAVMTIDVKSCFPFLALALYLDNCEEKQKYYELIMDGFYEWIATLSPERFYGMTPAEERAFAKEQCFKNIFFTRKGSKRENWIWGPFCLRFPKLAAIMAEADSLAATLQRMEVDAVFGAVSQLQEKQIRCVSVHDGLLVPESAADEAAGLLRSEFARLTGYEPAVTVIYDHLEREAADTANSDKSTQNASTNGRRTAAASTGSLYPFHTLSNSMGTAEPHETPQSNTLQPPLTDFTDTEIEHLQEDFRRIVWRLPHGKWSGIYRESVRIDWDQFALEGILTTVEAAKAARSDFLPEWSVQTDISAKNCRFRIDHIEQ